jgi:phage-related protein
VAQREGPKFKSQHCKKREVEVVSVQDKMVVVDKVKNISSEIKMKTTNTDVILGTITSIKICSYKILNLDLKISGYISPFYGKFP